MSRVWVVFPFVGAIRLSTVLAFIATVAILTWYRRSLLVGLVVGMGWVSAFEIVYQAVGTIYGRHDALHLFYLTFSMSGWVLAAYLVGVRPHPWLLVAWSLVFLGWIASGFHPNLYDHPNEFSVVQELFNVGTKDGLAAIFVIGALRAVRSGQPAQAPLPLATRAEGGFGSNLIAFDAVAADYDRDEAANPIRQLMRGRSLAILESTFPHGAALLDVGCGTGTEAIWLAERGRTMFAVDSSPQMLEVLSRRAAAAELQVSTRLLRAGELLTLVNDFGEGSFDGAYSSFGALNTEPTLAAPLAALSHLVRPGGRIVLSVMNRWCVAEMVLLAGRGRGKEALRRTRSSLRVAVGSNSTEVRYPSWHELRQAVATRFQVVSVQALPLLLLPYAWPALSAHPRLYRALRGADQILAPRRPFAWLGDHLLVVAERR